MPISESVTILVCCASLAYCGLVEFNENLGNQLTLDQNVPVNPLLHAEEDNAVTVKEKRCPRVGASNPLGSSSNIVGAVNPSTLDLKDQMNKQLCKACKNRHSCKQLKKCDSCNRWCDISDSPNNLATNENIQEPVVGATFNEGQEEQPLVSLASRVAIDDEDNKIQYTVITLQSEPMKNTLADLLGVENKFDIDTLGCWVTTHSNNPPVINADSLKALKSNNPLQALLKNQKPPNAEVVGLAEVVKQQIKKELEDRIKDYKKDVLSKEEMEQLIKDVISNIVYAAHPETPSTNNDLKTSARSSFDDAILPRYPFEPQMDSFVMPQTSNPDIIEGPPDMSRLLGSSNPLEEKNQNISRKEVKETQIPITDSLPAASNIENVVQRIPAPDTPEYFASTFKPIIQNPEPKIPVFDPLKNQPRGFEHRNNVETKQTDLLRSPHKDRLDTEQDENLLSGTQLMKLKMDKYPNYQQQHNSYYRANEGMVGEPFKTTEEPGSLVIEEVRSPKLVSDSLINSNTGSNEPQMIRNVGEILGESLKEQPQDNTVMLNAEDQQTNVAKEFEQPEARTHHKLHKKLKSKKLPQYPNYHRSHEPQNEMVELAVTNTPDKFENYQINQEVGEPITISPNISTVNTQEGETVNKEEIENPETRTHHILHKKLKSKKLPQYPSNYRANNPQNDMVELAVTDKTEGLENVRSNEEGIPNEQNKKQDSLKKIEESSNILNKPTDGIVELESPQSRTHKLLKKLKAKKKPQYPSYYRANDPESDKVELAVTDKTDKLENQESRSPDIGQRTSAPVENTEVGNDKKDAIVELENPESRTHKLLEKLIEKKIPHYPQYPEYPSKPYYPQYPEYPNYYRANNPQSDVVGLAVTDKTDELERTESNSADIGQRSSLPVEQTEIANDKKDGIVELENPEPRTHKLLEKLIEKKMPHYPQYPEYPKKPYYREYPEYPSYYRANDPQSEKVELAVTDKTDELENPESNSADNGERTVPPVEQIEVANDKNDEIVELEKPEARTHKLLEKLIEKKLPHYPQYPEYPKKPHYSQYPEYPGYYRANDPQSDVVELAVTDKTNELENKGSNSADIGQSTLLPTKQTEIANDKKDAIVEFENPETRTHKLLKKLKAKKKPHYSQYPEYPSYYRTNDPQNDKVGLAVTDKTDEFENQEPNVADMGPRASLSVEQTEISSDNKDAIVEPERPEARTHKLLEKLIEKKMPHYPQYPEYPKKPYYPVYPEYPSYYRANNPQSDVVAITAITDKTAPLENSELNSAAIGQPTLLPVEQTEVPNDKKDVVQLENPEPRTHKLLEKLIEKKMPHYPQYPEYPKKPYYPQYPEYPSYYRTNDPQSEKVELAVTDKTDELENPKSNTADMSQRTSLPIEQTEIANDQTDVESERPEARTHKLLEKLIEKKMPHYPQYPEYQKKPYYPQYHEYQSYYRANDPQSEKVELAVTDKTNELEDPESKSPDIDQRVSLPIEQTDIPNDQKYTIVEPQRPEARTHKLLEKLIEKKMPHYPEYPQYPSYYRSNDPQSDKVKLAHETQNDNAESSVTEKESTPKNPPLDETVVSSPKEQLASDGVVTNQRNGILEPQEPASVVTELENPDARTHKLLKKLKSKTIPQYPSYYRANDPHDDLDNGDTAQATTDKLIKKIDSILGQNNPESVITNSADDKTRTHEHHGKILKKKGHKFIEEDSSDGVGAVRNDQDEEDNQFLPRLSEPDSISDLIGPNMLGKPENEFISTNNNAAESKIDLEKQPDIENNNPESKLGLKTKLLLKKLKRKKNKHNQLPPDYYRTSDGILGNPNDIKNENPPSVHEDLVNGFKNVEPFSITSSKPDQSPSLDPPQTDRDREIDSNPTQLLSRLTNGDSITKDAEKDFEEVQSALEKLREMTEKLKLEQDKILKTKNQDPSAPQKVFKFPNTDVAKDIENIPKYLLDEAKKTVTAIESEGSNVSGNVSEIVGSQPLENSFEIYQPSYVHPYKLHQKPLDPKSVDLVGSSLPQNIQDQGIETSPSSNSLGIVTSVRNNVDVENDVPQDIYFVGNGVKLPLHMVKNEEGTIHLAVDVDKLCSCRNVSCHQNKSAIEETMGTILEKEAELKDLIHIDHGDFVLGMGAPKFEHDDDANKFNSESSELQHENPDILKRSLMETRMNDVLVEPANDSIKSKSEINNTKDKQDNLTQNEIEKNKISEQQNSMDSEEITNAVATSTSKVDTPTTTWNAFVDEPENVEKSTSNWNDFISKRISDIRSNIPNIDNFVPFNMPQNIFRKFGNTEPSVPTEKLHETTASPSLGLRLRSFFNRPTKAQDNLGEIPSDKKPLESESNIAHSLSERLRNFFNQPFKNAEKITETSNLGTSVGSRLRGILDRSNDNKEKTTSTANENNVNIADEKFDLKSPVDKPYQFKETEKQFENSLKKIDKTIEDYNKKNGEIIKKEADALLAATENATVKEEVGIINNFLTWLRNVVTSNKNSNKTK